MQSTTTAVMPAEGTPVSTTDRERIARYNEIPHEDVPPVAIVTHVDPNATHGTITGDVFVWASQVTASN